MFQRFILLFGVLGGFALAEPLAPQEAAEIVPVSGEVEPTPVWPASTNTPPTVDCTSALTTASGQSRTRVPRREWEKALLESLGCLSSDLAVAKQQLIVMEYQLQVANSELQRMERALGAVEISVQENAQAVVLVSDALAEKANQSQLDALTASRSAGKPTPQAATNTRPTSGSNTVIHFWSTSCAPCVNELAIVIQRFSTLQREGVKVRYVAEELPERQELARRVFAEKGGAGSLELAPPTGSPRRGTLKVKRDVQPLTVVVSPSGAPRLVVAGVLTEADFRRVQICATDLSSQDPCR